MLTVSEKFCFCYGARALPSYGEAKEAMQNTDNKEPPFGFYL
jgi:hypothetical protein